MKYLKGILLMLFAAGMVSCGGYTEEQSEAADAFCECMEQEGDFDINFYNCDIEIVEKYGGEIMTDEGWSLALEEKCPDVAGEIVDQ